jgi:hypothetical protein
MSKEVRELVQKFRPNLSLGEYGKIFTDTTAYMEISYGDIIEVDGIHYLVLRDEVERSFGIEDPKYWVKRCIQLETGERKILKLVFHERFLLKLGTLEIPCYRSPEKEARILDLVRGDMRFMQGFSRFDKKGNVVRIIDIVSGKRLDHSIFEIEASHKDYFYGHLPGILEKFIESCRAIKFLHDNGEIHGDIRRDHLWVEYKTGLYRWIDFDYTYEFKENPFGLDIFGLGSLLIYIVGKQIYTLSNLASQGFPPETASSLNQGDFSLLYKNRIVNLKKLFPYIPDRLNFILMHFSNAAEIFYETVDEFLEDLEPCISEIKR